MAGETLGLFADTFHYIPCPVGSILLEDDEGTFGGKEMIKVITWTPTADKVATFVPRMSLAGIAYEQLADRIFDLVLPILV